MVTDVLLSEVDRAIDNLVKSGKLWSAPRRDSMPMMMGRQFPEYGMNCPSSTHASESESRANSPCQTPVR